MCYKPVNVDVDQKIFEVVHSQPVEVGVGLVHLHGVHVLVCWHVFRQLKETINRLVSVLDKFRWPKKLKKKELVRFGFIL